MSLSLDVLEVFAEAQGLALSPEWMGDAGHLLTRSTRPPSLWTTDKAAYYREWRRKNPAKARAIVRKYETTAKGKAKKAAAWQRYYEKNAPRLREAARRRHAAMKEALQ